MEGYTLVEAVGEGVVISIPVVRLVRVGIGEVEVAGAVLDVPLLESARGRRIQLSLILEEVFVLEAFIEGVVRARGNVADVWRDVGAALDTEPAQLRKHPLRVGEVTRALVNSERAVIVLHVDVNMHTINREVGLPVSVDGVQDHLLRVIAVTPLMITQDVSGLELRLADNGGVQLNDFLNAVSGEEDALETVETRRYPELSWVLHANVHTDLGVVVDEGSDLGLVTRLGVHLNPVRFRVVERLTIIQGTDAVDILVPHIVKVCARYFR